MAMWVFSSVNPILNRRVQRALQALAVVVHTVGKHRVETGMVLPERRLDWANLGFGLVLLVVHEVVPFEADVSVSTART